jgi:hypothetical protein
MQYNKVRRNYGTEFPTSWRRRDHPSSPLSDSTDNNSGILINPFPIFALQSRRNGYIAEIALDIVLIYMLTSGGA